MDQETQQIISEGEAINDFIKTKSWRLIKEIISNKMMDLQSVMNVEASNPADMAVEVQARRLASTYLFSVLQDVEGIANQYESNKSLALDPVQII